MSELVHIKTPFIRSNDLERFGGLEVWLKCENMQITNSFKARGAANAVRNLPENTRGVITHSSGNHGQALAWAAKRRGIPAIIVVPENAPQVKIAAIQRHGARIHFCAPGMKAREAAMHSLIEENGYVFVPPYNHQDIIDGQSTCALEMLAEHPNLDVILVPVGGGGLLSGTLLACRDTPVNVYACEPSLADDAYRSFQSGKIEDPGNPKTIADGLRTGLGDLTFGYMKAHVKDVLLVDEEEIHAAWAYAIHAQKLIIEPSCAVPLAALKRYAHLFENKRVGIIITGGNVDMDTLPKASDMDAYLSEKNLP